MKKLFVSLLIAASMAGIISMPRNAQAVDFGVGLYSYYTWWNPAWRSIYSDVKNDPMMLWGPYLSVTFFEKLSFSALLMQNFPNAADSSFVYEGSGVSGAYKVKLDSNIIRNDIDLSVSYKATSSLSFVIGFKMLNCNVGEGGPTAATVSPETYTSVLTQWI